MSVAVLRGDARHLPLPDASVDLIVTSPPYFGLRSYTDGGEHYAGQIGSEATPAAYVAALTECTREWVRVLKPSGSLFVNLGDKYAGSASGGPQNGACGKRATDGDRKRGHIRLAPGKVPVTDTPAKSLMGLPWRYALACIDDLGLILRAEIIWSKPNGLPESVTDRVRRSHEQVFHFTRQPRYYSAVDEVREPHLSAGDPRWLRSTKPVNGDRRDGGMAAWRDGREPNPLGKLPGSVWDIASQPLTVPASLGTDHFAAFPMELPRRIIAGWSPPGICTACGEGRRPVPTSAQLDMSRPQARRAHQMAERGGLTEDHLSALRVIGLADTGRSAATQAPASASPENMRLAAEARAVLGGYAREYLLRRPTGISYACACPDTTAPTRPAIVLDPFAGTGTTLLAADALGRHAIGVDRSADYCRLARWRTADPGERAKAMQVPKPPPVAEGQDALFAM